MMAAKEFQLRGIIHGHILLGLCKEMTKVEVSNSVIASLEHPDVASDSEV